MRGTTFLSPPPAAKTRTTSIATILRSSPDTEDDEEGPYLDLEFSLPEENESESHFSSKFRVFMLRFKKPKPHPAQTSYNPSKLNIKEVRVVSLLKKDVINRYLSKIKPFKKRAARAEGGEVTALESEHRAKSGGLRRLRKSRSASAAVRSPLKGSDDSMLLHEDGIQSAIAHCKRSFSNGSDLALARCRSDPGAERCD